MIYDQAKELLMKINGIQNEHARKWTGTIIFGFIKSSNI